jgi:hypothetical protein
VENPNYARMRQACVNAKNNFNRCLEIRAREKAAAQQCQAAINKGKSNHNQCVAARNAEVRTYGYSLRSCYYSAPYCSTTWRGCSADQTRQVCARFAGTSQTMQVPVYSIYRYVIYTDHVTSTLPVSLTIGKGKGHLVRATLRATFSESDDYNNSAPAYNVSNDPRVLPSPSEIMAELSGQIVSRARDLVQKSKVMLCTDMRTAADALNARGRVRKYLHAVGVQRQAGCDESDDDRSRASTTLRDYLDSL